MVGQPAPIGPAHPQKSHPYLRTSLRQAYAAEKHRCVVVSRYTILYTRDPYRIPYSPGRGTCESRGPTLDITGPPSGIKRLHENRALPALGNLSLLFQHAL